MAKKIKRRAPMRPKLHKHLLVYESPKGVHYYRYGTKPELKEWADGKKGRFQRFKLGYAKKKSWAVA